MVVVSPLPEESFFVVPDVAGTEVRELLSVFGLAERLGIPRSESKELIDGYFSTYPRIKEYMEESIKVAKEKGYVETIFKRKRFLPDINSHNAVVRGYAERNAINAPIQGSAADIMKLAMVQRQGQIGRNGIFHLDRV